MGIRNHNIPIYKYLIYQILMNICMKLTLLQLRGMNADRATDRNGAADIVHTWMSRMLRIFPSDTRTKNRSATNQSRAPSATFHRTPISPSRRRSRHAAVPLNKEHPWLRLLAEQ